MLNFLNLLNEYIHWILNSLLLFFYFLKQLLAILEFFFFTLESLFIQPEIFADN